jgi:transmembrane sensor
MESSRQIEERAAAWLTKRDGGDWSDADQAQLMAWLEASTLHRVAFLRLEAGWEEANRLKALGAGFPRGKVPSISELQGGTPQIEAALPANGATVRAKSGVGRLRLIALAASLLVTISSAVLLYTVGPLAGERYTTPVGGVSSVPLKDGSNVTLNTASKIRVELTEKERRIDLTEGEAFFDVAKDPSRPFIVRAGAKRIIAVGTEFSVRKDGDDVRVIVTEGVVRLEDAQTSRGIANANTGLSGEGPRLTAGVIARATAGKVLVQPTSLPLAEELLSWRTGYVVFHEAALADAVAEFNRYNERKIVIRDPRVAGMRLTGKFRANNFEGFVRLLEESFPVRTQHLPDQIVLTDATPDTEGAGTAEPQQ